MRNDCLEQEDNYIKITEPCYGGDEPKVIVESLSLWLVARCVNTRNVASFLSTYLNSFSVDFKTGKTIGELFRNEHRTLQGSLYRFVLGILVGLSDQNYTDARNEVAVENSKKIKRMVDDGEIEVGYMI
jgi:hypothetical protein